MFLPSQCLYRFFLFVYFIFFALVHWLGLLYNLTNNDSQNSWMFFRLRAEGTLNDLLLYIMFAYFVFQIQFIRSWKFAKSFCVFVFFVGWLVLMRNRIFKLIDFIFRKFYIYIKIGYILQRSYHTHTHTFLLLTSCIM